MFKLLSTTALAAMLAVSGAALAQQSQGNAQAQGGGQGSPSAQGGQAQSNQGQGTAGRAGESATTPRPGMAQGTTGTTTGTMTDDQLRTRLTAEGYTGVENITRSGNMYHARAMQNGRAVDLTIDPATGAIRSQAAAR